MEPTVRKEWKYVIPVSEYLRLEPWLCRIMHPDEHGENGTYLIRSLYFDSLNDRDLRDNLDGVQKKQKIRLRCYPPELTKAALECKSKNGSDGAKYRVELTADEVQAVASGDYSCLAQRRDAIARNIYLRMAQGGYQPKTVIEYQRTAYLYPASDTRITFDRGQRATATGFGFLEENPSFLPLMSDGMGVMEIKYNRFLPYPISELMQKLDRLSEANSKYTRARILV